MTLETGSRLGSYEVVAPLGAGGMGEVYRARDTKLGREVALKILPPDFALDEERLARFEREAQLLASLNHPRIAGIHGLEEHDGQPFLALELVEGEDLSERLSRGALPQDEAAAVALQIVDALEGAHEKGIIHRDLKPANIKLTPEGEVKVLDFGLAKALDPSAETSVELSQSPTMTRDSTRAGMILGTAAYMSPEQAKGKAVDERTDVFAFGAVVYEMLCGKKAFAGEDVGEILASVIKTEPDWEALPAATPRHVRRVLERCLTKNPRERYHAIADARIDLAEESHESITIAAPGSSPSKWTWGVAALIAVSTLALILWPRVSPPLPVLSLAVTPPPGTTLQALPAISPDGKWIAMLVSGASDGAVILRTTDGRIQQTVPDSAAASSPFFWSPDSTEVGFQKGNALVKAAIDGGASTPLCDLGTEGPRGLPSWSSRGDILFAVFDSGFRRCSAGGGRMETVDVRLEDEPIFLLAPRFVENDRRSFQFSAIYPQNTVRHYRASLDDSSFVMPEETDDRAVSASGYAISRRNGMLLARKNGTSSRDGTPIVAMTRSDGWAVSRTGLLLFARGPRQDEGRVQLVDRAGAALRTFGETGDFWAPRVTPEGSFFIAEVHGEQGAGDLNTFDIASGRMERVTFDPMHHNAFVAWSPDSRRAVFHSSRPPNGGLFEVAPFDGTEERRLRDSPSSVRPTDWSPDGGVVLMDAYAESWDILAYDTESGELTPFLATEAMDFHGHFAPGGEFLAYASDATGEVEVYLRSYPEPGFLRQVSVGGGEAPRFRSDGRELFYLAPGNTVMSVSLDLTRQPPAIGTPDVLFQAPIRQARGILRTAINWDVLPDGQAFVIIANEQDSWHDATMIVNWPELVRRAEEDGS